MRTYDRSIILKIPNPSYGPEFFTRSLFRSWRVLTALALTLAAIVFDVVLMLTLKWPYSQIQILLWCLPFALIMKSWDSISRLQQLQFIFREQSGLGDVKPDSPLAITLGVAADAEISNLARFSFILLWVVESLGLLLHSAK